MEISKIMANYCQGKITPEEAIKQAEEQGNQTLVDLINILENEE